MKKRLGLFLIILLFISSCSQKEEIVTKTTDSSASEPASTIEEQEGSTIAPPVENQPVAVSKGKLVESSLDYIENAGGVQFNFKIKNNIDHPLTLHFKTTQRYDYILRDENSKIIKQLSKEQTYFKLPGQEFFKPNGEIQYKETIKDLPKGSYSITFIFMAKEEPSKVTMKFTIN